ncbi:recombinase family protein [Butyrivibrio sp.]|uniref:recombinase family protein n=1 Tax=Butyrivibrio sp. TaxID=28121 RepID=UPI003FA44EC2
MRMSNEQMEDLLASTYKVGVYCRLSKEDEDSREGESQSISHQREIIEGFCKKKGWRVEDVYVDDGYSGTTSNRPSLQRLLSDIEEKRINVVVTKDYSRLGRDNLFTEQLREIWFPKHNCRYVAINDNIDTMYEDEYAPFKAVINSQYSKDISKKVHSSYLNQAEKGRYTGVVPPFGYLKDPEDTYHLVIDEETAPYVRQIFDWALDGHGTAFIKRHLEENKVPCPTWWNRKRGFRNHFTKWEIQDPENGKYVWDDSVIADMLINPVYYGAVASQKKNYKFKVGVINEKKPEEWIVVENTHEPLVDQDSFDIIQQKIASRKCSRGDGTYSLFAGLIKCGECGKALTIRKTNAKHPQDVYACVTYNRHGKHHCTQHRVEYDMLYDIVFDEIKRLAKQTVDAEEVARSLADAYEHERENQKELLERNIAKARSRIETLDRMTSKLYEDLLSGRITENIFESMIEKTKTEADDLEKQIAEDEKSLSKNDSESGNARKWIDLIKDYADITELDADTLNRLINKIIVHEEITEGGDRNISMEIHYNFRPTDESKTYNLSDMAAANSVAKAM